VASSSRFSMRWDVTWKLLTMPQTMSWPTSTWCHGRGRRCADHHFHRAPCGLHQHVGGDRFVVDELRHAALLGEGGVKAGHFDLLAVEGREASKLANACVMVTSRSFCYSSSILMTGGRRRAGPAVGTLAEAGSAGASPQVEPAGNSDRQARTDPADAASGAGEPIGGLVAEIRTAHPWQAPGSLPC
jgi:hypothetical protein